MKKTHTTKIDTTPDTERADKQLIRIQYDSETIENMMAYVKGNGFTTVTELKEMFGPEKYTRCIAVLYNDLRMFRKVSRPWKDETDAVGYEWADRRFNKSEAKKVPPELYFAVEATKMMMAKYSDFQTVTAHCQFTTAALGGVPVKDVDNQPINAFERDAAGRLLILRYNLRAMITPALAIIGKEQALARRIGFHTIRLEVNGNLTKVERPVNDHGQGKGFCRSEKLADGTTFTITAEVPTSILSVAEYIRALRIAGETVGLSPGRSAGFGDFEVVSVED